MIIAHRIAAHARFRQLLGQAKDDPLRVRLLKHLLITAFLLLVAVSSFVGANIPLYDVLSRQDRRLANFRFLPSPGALTVMG